MTLSDIFSQSEGKHHARNQPGERHLVRDNGAWSLRTVPPARVRVQLSHRSKDLPPGVMSGSAVVSGLPTVAFQAQRVAS